MKPMKTVPCRPLGRCSFNHGLLQVHTHPRELRKKEVKRGEGRRKKNEANGIIQRVFRLGSKALSW